MKDRILNGLMLIAVAAALALTWVRGGPEQEDSLPIQALTAAATAAPHPAEVYRARRAQERQMEASLLTALMESASAAPETKARAQEQLLSVTGQTELELLVEAAFAAHGCPEALCVARDGGVTLFLPTEITREEADYFFSLARDASGLAPENIRLTGF